MPGNPRAITREADATYPVRVRLNVPGAGLGTAMEAMHAWLDESCGVDGWTTGPAGMRGGVNDAVAFYFRDATLAAAFVASFCAAGASEVENGAYKVRADAPVRRTPTQSHSWPR